MSVSLEPWSSVSTEVTASIVTVRRTQFLTRSTHVEKIIKKTERLRESNGYITRRKKNLSERDTSLNPVFIARKTFKIQIQHAI